jgi:hypothetical protein
MPKTDLQAGVGTHPIPPAQEPADESHSPPSQSRQGSYGVTRDAAVAAAKRGWAVFPCRPNDKRPTVRDWERRACSDPERVARYWPGDRHNIGIACGPSRLVVLDLDAHGELPEDWRRLPGVTDGKDVLAQICEWAGMDWPATYTVATPSGGWHLYFTSPDGAAIRNSASMTGPQVDVRAQGGYVVGAGSAVGDAAYEVIYDQAPVPLPEWIARLLAPAPARTVARPIRHGTAGGRLAGLLRTVEQAQQGTRNERLFWAASRAAEMVAVGSADAREVTEQLVAAAVSAGLPDAEARRTIASAMRGDAR